MNPPRVGAVAYLNMLPFFHSGDVVVYPTPRLLNDAARAGTVDAACMSAIAGLRAGFEPLQPAFGIGARGPVQSVYLEPVCLSPGDEALLLAWQSDLALGLESALTPETWSGPPSREVALFTSGASEHSEWLACTLLGSRGIRARVVREPALALLEPGDLQSFVETRRRGLTAALLVIGDPALRRAEQFPASLRFDLATAWQRFSGLPCVFAAWFRCTSQDTALLANRLRETLASWQCQDERQRQAAIARFLLGSGISAQRPASLENLSAYVRGISHEFDNDFLRTLAAYRKLLSAQALAFSSLSRSPSCAQGFSLP